MKQHKYDARITRIMNRVHIFLIMMNYDDVTEKLIVKIILKNLPILMLELKVLTTNVSRRSNHSFCDRLLLTASLQRPCKVMS